jgi:hypothetical protein
VWWRSGASYMNYSTQWTFWPVPWGREGSAIPAELYIR